MEWKNIITAAFGLVGVLVGGFLTIVKESWFNKKQKQKEAEYLSIQIVSMLDRFIGGCVEVVYDDGLCDGQSDERGYSSIQVTPPEFKPETVDVEWKSLPANLMYEVLSLPGDIEDSRGKISNAFEYLANPPDFYEGFEERQYQYAELGLKALRLSLKLRQFSGLPAKDYGEWDPTTIFKDNQRQIEEVRNKRAGAQSKLFKEFGSSEDGG